jgi:hypothetical protein
VQHRAQAPVFQSKVAFLHWVSGAEGTTVGGSRAADKHRGARDQLRKRPEPRRQRTMAALGNFHPKIILDKSQFWGSIEYKNRKNKWTIVTSTFKIDITELTLFCLIFHLLVPKIEIRPQIHFGQKFSRTAIVQRRAVRHVPPANLAAVGLVVLLACKQGWARRDRSHGGGEPRVPRRPSVGAAAAFHECRYGLPRRGVRRRKVDSVVRAAIANSERSRATREGSKYSTVQLTLNWEIV